MRSFFFRYQTVLRWIPAMCFAIAIFGFSATPGDEVQASYRSIEMAAQTIASPTVSSPAEPATATVPATPAIDWLKIGHGIGYFCLGVSVLYVLSLRPRWSPSVALILCCIYSFTDEFHQIFIPGRTASARDILIDTLAALMGVTMMLFAHRLVRVFSFPAV